MLVKSSIFTNPYVPKFKHARSHFCGRSIRRRFSRGLPRKYTTLLNKLRKAKKEAPMHEKPDVVKTHLRNMVIMPEMIGSMVGVYNGKTFTGVEIKVFTIIFCDKYYLL